MSAAPLRGVFAIPAGAAFLDDLAAGLAAAYPPAVLAEARVYLPTRRACRDLVEAFLRLPGEAGLLPTAYPLGDVEADDLAFAATEPALGLAAAALDLPPAVSPLARRFQLARLAQAKHRAEHGAPLPLAAALRLGEALGQFLDELAIERVDPARIGEIDAGDFAEHWQRVLTFLEIVLAHWPAHLKAEDRMDPAARREALLEAQVNVWLADPPGTPIVVAGSTGALPSTRALMRAALASPLGAVVLPGFEADVAPDDRKAILAAPAHPQHAMAAALDALEIPSGDVRPWPASDFASGRPRRAFVAEALRPAATVEAWAGLDRFAFDDATDDLLRVDAPNEDMEARVIALFLRDRVHRAAPGDRAALVTPDRMLARRVAAELARWEIEADDSAGRPLGETTVGAFLRLVARACRPGAGAIDWLALMKHPLAGGGMSRARFRRRARAVELAIWRDSERQRAANSLAAVANELHRSGPKSLAEFVDGVVGLTAPLAGVAGGTSQSFSDLMTAHIQTAEALATTDREAGADRLWRGPDGEAAATLLAEALDAADACPPLRAADYADAFDAIAEGAAVRPRPKEGAQVAILGVLEARLGRFSAVALGGLDEGLWPRQPPADPWFSRAMRRQIGLSDPERRVGLSAHDFAQHLAGPDVLLTRSLRRDGAPTKPSRWLERLDAALAAAHAGPLAENENDFLDWAKRLDPALPPIEIPPPAFAPPVEARPRRLSVTRVKTLMTDPYAIYARYVLGLKALGPLDPPPSPADRGKIVHAAFEIFLSEWPRDLPDDIAAALMDAGEKAFEAYSDDPAIAAFWRPAFDRAALWAAPLERQRRLELDVAEVLSEETGGAVFPAPGGDFRIEARADRIDVLKDGRLAIVDVKTGAPPSKKSLLNATEPQMPLEAAIGLHGGFGGLKEKETAELAIWRVGGGASGKQVALDQAESMEAAEIAWAGLRSLIAAFDDPATPYLSEPRGQAGFSDYRGLARLSDEVEERS